MKRLFFLLTVLLPLTGMAQTSVTIDANGNVLNFPSPSTKKVNYPTGKLSINGVAVDTALAGKEPTINAGTTSQYWRGDKSWQTLPTFPATIAATASNWLRSYDASTGIFTKSQPSFSDLSGAAVIGQLPTGTTNSTVATGDRGVTTLTLNTPTLIYSNPITFTNTGGAWSGTLTPIAQAANTFFGNGTGSSATPTFMSASTAKTALSLNLVENTALSTWAGSGNITTLGTVTGGTWNANIVTGTYGGTGVNNGTKTITLGNNFITSGNFALTLTQTGTTNVTLPTTGTLATLAGAEAFTNKNMTGAGNTWPTFNQSTTGSAATLTTARSIYGNNFDGSAALSQIIASTYGGTGNGFTKLSGPTTSEKTKTVRDANDTILELGGSYTPTGTWTNMTLVAPVLGTPASGVVTNLTGTASININGTVGATTPAAGTFTTLVAGNATSLLLGTSGSAVGSVGFRNATSGTATLAPPTGALGTYQVTLPNAASTLPIFGQQLTFSGPTTARTVTLPDANFTAARTDAANTFTGTQTFSGDITSHGGQVPYTNKTTLGSAATSITISIPSGYTNAKVIFNGRGDSAVASVQARITFNSDTSSIYDWSVVIANGTGGTVTPLDGHSAAYIYGGAIPAATATANFSGGAFWFIPNYAGTTFYKTLVGNNANPFSTAANGAEVQVPLGNYRSTSALTSITVTASAGNWVTGTSLSVTVE